jgi:hypothetical protein
MADEYFFAFQVLLQSEALQILLNRAKSTKASGL